RISSTDSKFSMTRPSHFQLTGQKFNSSHAISYFKPPSSNYPLKLTALGALNMLIPAPIFVKVISKTVCFYSGSESRA
ncbi:MAG: hypothetical protein OEW48_19540, partial [Phycisphaerae bacterium]|nr:hypothetical protein [Phycisphaerae bacterium]